MNNFYSKYFFLWKLGFLVLKKIISIILLKANELGSVVEHSSNSIWQSKFLHVKHSTSSNTLTKKSFLKICLYIHLLQISGKCLILWAAESLHRDFISTMLNFEPNPLRKLFIFSSVQINGKCLIMWTAESYNRDFIQLWLFNILHVHNSILCIVCMSLFFRYAS